VKPGASTEGAQRGGARSGSLNLIHRNNSPKPVSMRVSGTLAMPEHAWRQGYQDGLLSMAICPYPPMTSEAWAWSSGLIEGRAANGAKTT
jgi:ribosome modulation factor